MISRKTWEMSLYDEEDSSDSDLEFSPKPRLPGTKTTGLGDDDDDSEEHREETKQRIVTYNLHQKHVVMKLAQPSLGADNEIEDKINDKDNDNPDYKEHGLNSDEREQR